MTILAAAALSSAVLPPGVSAHHSRSVYSDQVQELAGELVGVAWRNPHVGFTLKTLDAEGREELWQVEGFGSIYSLHRSGVTRDMFKPGDRVRFAGALSTRRPREFLATHVLLADGTEAVLQANADPHWKGAHLGGQVQWAADESETVDAASENRGIFRVWSIPRLADRVMHLPFTEAAVAARAQWDPLDNFASRCEPEGMPRIMTNPHPFEFVDHGTEILLRSELYDVVRTIHMEASAAGAGPTASSLGYSVGRWEGPTLVVQTTRINWPYFDNLGTPQSEDVAIVERFTHSANQARLDYHMTVTDPATFTEPAVIEGHWLALGETVQRYECTVSR